MRTHGTVSCYRNGGCRCDECRMAVRDIKRLQAQPTLSVQPMIDKLPIDFRIRFRDSLINWQKNGIRLYRADKICIQYGYHPYEVYGDTWYEDIWNKEKKQNAKS